MEQEKTAIDVKGYKKQARTAAASYLKRKRAAKGEERKAVKKEQKQKILAWKLGLVALSKPERKAQKKAFKAYKKRLALMRTIAVWAAVIVGIPVLCCRAFFSSLPRKQVPVMELTAIRSTGISEIICVMSMIFFVRSLNPD